MACVLLCLGGCQSETMDRTLTTRDWPTDMVTPIQGTTFSLAESHLPGAPRDYRNGTHQGFDFFNGTAGRALAANEPVVAIAAGEIIRIDHDYQPPDQSRQAYYSQMANDAGFVGDFALDQLRGRQVWIRHKQGHVSRYAHLSEVHPELQHGDSIEQGHPVGLMGNTGIPITDDQPEPAPHLHFELWSPDGTTHLGQALEPLNIHRTLARAFGMEALPRYARQVVASVNDGDPAPETYPPESLPDTGFTVDPPEEVAVGQAFAAPITWEDDDFTVDDFFASLEGAPLGVIDAGNGAWVLAAIPIGIQPGEIQLTVGSVDQYGQSLVGQRAITVSNAATMVDPMEVDQEILNQYNSDSIQAEAQRLGRVTMASLKITQPRWDSAFHAPLEGNVIGDFGQRMVAGPMKPSQPRPGLLISPDGNNPVLASNDGIVALTEELPIRGRTLVIDHGGGVITVYGNLAEFLAGPGETVSKGQPIGTVGRSGAIDDDLLRWEIHVAGIPSNPLAWLEQLLPGR